MVGAMFSWWLLCDAASARSPRPTVLDLVRPGAGTSRIYVQAGLPDGSVGLFLVDTGADISVLSKATAERLHLEAGQRSQVAGVTGAAEVELTTLPFVDLGGELVSDVLVAVNVPGLGDTAGFMPVDGLLGNNVWQGFVLEVDYPRDRMVLHPSQDKLAKGRSAPMWFDGSHIYAVADVTTDEPAPRTVPVVVQVDTGASELTICAGTGAPFAGNHTEGLEALFGIGASETLPPYRFLSMTRRIPVSSVRLGRRTVEVPIPARWRDYEASGSPTCAQGAELRALLGHEYLARHRVVFDYEHGRWALLRPRGKPRQLDGHVVLLDQELARHGEVAERGLDRGKLLLGAGRDEDAVRALQAHVDSADPDPLRKAEGRALLAQVLRSEARHAEAWALLEGLSAGDLVDQDQLVGTVNGLVFEGRADEARSLAERGVAERPGVGWSHVALADVHLAARALDQARDELLVAADLEGYPDAHLLRRARVALAAGDRVGSMAYVRKLLALYPGDGPTLWFYAMLVESDGDRERFRQDVEVAMARLHPHTRPLDFLLAAEQVLGGDHVEGLLHDGLQRDCAPLDGADFDNCRAWYLALAHEQPDEALMRIERALQVTGERPDFLDTKAMVHLSRGESALALAAAESAARMSPDDVYMLWQAERIADLAGRTPGSPR
jgi:tetratricopeptide (TPR) repeat protein